MAQLGDGKRDAGRPEKILYYRDYIKSVHWEVRKQQYYSRHAKACYVCGDTDRVELDHKQYGNYGHERDIDLVPLCRTHHQIITDRHTTRKNMRYQHDYMVVELKREWDAKHEKPVASVIKEKPVVGRRITVYEVVDKMARPIWKIVSVVLMHK